MLGIWSKTTKVENKEIRNVTQSRYKKDNWVGKYKVNENKNISTVDKPEPRTIEILATRYLKKFPRLYPILKKLYHLSFFLLRSYYEKMIHWLYFHRICFFYKMDLLFLDSLRNLLSV